jgi:cytochrome c oxidase subunit 2
MGALLLLATTLAACEGPQSALVTAGPDAARVARLWWWMAGGASLIWLVVVGLAWYAIRVNREEHSERGATLLIIGGGAVIPTVVLGGLLFYALSAMPSLMELPTDESVRIEVSGEQWWWRVEYQLPDGGSFELANEVYLPVGRRIETALVTPDVIHSFWIPSITGKMDMIPGRVNRLALEADRTGVFRGACAEYCGASHALMSLYAVVVEEAEFDAWMEAQAATARAPASELAREGQRVFMETGCGACHAVRGTPAQGVIGPDLTHVGGRVSLGAGILPNEPQAFERWIARPDSIKPGVHMPSFGMLPAGRIRALAAYLEELQ